MAYRRRYRKRPLRPRRNFGRRRYGRRRLYRRRRTTSRYSFNKVYSFKRRIPFGTVITSTVTASAESSYSFTFSLAAIAGYTEFTTLFDQYKITGVKCIFLPRVDNNPNPDSTSGVAVGNPTTGLIYYTPDYDDANPAASAALSQYQGVRITRGDQPFSIFIRPRIAVAAYTGTGQIFTGYMNTQGWLDSASSGIPHYGLKLSWTQTTPQQMTYDVQAIYYVKFKNVH